MNLIWTWKFWFENLDSFSADSRIMAWVLTPSIYYLRKRLETVQIKHTLSEIKKPEIWLSNFVTWKLPKFSNICYTPNFSLTITYENKLWGLGVSFLFFILNFCIGRPRKFNSRDIGISNFIFSNVESDSKANCKI